MVKTFGSTLDIVRQIIVVAFLASAPPGAFAQRLPSYQPVNPMLASRSPLGFQPFVEGSKRTSARCNFEYASMVEYIEGVNRFLVIDGEFARLGCSWAWSKKRVFVGASLTVNGAFPGFMDGFLDWYHDLVGLEVKPRTLRPNNQFDYALIFVTGDTIIERRPSRYLGDPFLFLGVRLTDNWQSRIAVSVPLAPEAYGRQTVSASVVTNGWVAISKRLEAEFSVGFGATPRVGNLRLYQRAFFASGSAGVSFGFLERQHVYLNLFHQTPSYRGTRLPPIDKSETALDFGVLLRFANDGPVWQLGMTEDLDPLGPAVDLILKLGVRW